MIAKAGRGDARAPCLARALDAIERAGNRLPNPVSLFFLLAIAVPIASYVAHRGGITVTHPRDGSVVAAVNLLNASGVRRMFNEAVRNFMSFAPLGTVLAAMIGIGVAEKSGLIAVALRAFVMSVPRRLVTATVVFAGISSNIAADAGLVVLPPVAAQLFASVGRHPLAGIAAAFAGVAGGFSANILPSTIDVLLAGFTQEALDASRVHRGGYHVQILGNFYFMFVSTPLLTLLGTWVTDRFVEPRLGTWGADAPAGPIRVTSDERRGLFAASIALLVTLGAFLALVVPSSAPLRTSGATFLEQIRPFLDSMVVLVLIVFFVPGLAFGAATGRIRSDHDVAKMTGDTIASMGTYIVLAFVAAQFINYFAWSNLGSILAIAGAGLLRGMGLDGGSLLVAFVVFSAAANLFMSSASAKWAIVAPVFVPMFLLLGFTPEATQVAFRVGDSSTNIITPLFPYMPIIIGVAQRYDAKAGVGTLIALMLPYAIVFLVSWVALLVAFYVSGWPIGPGVEFLMPL